ncbi:MAG: hypothetical protein JWQ02_859 [Capsulimonas sp.]|nr:hypothetical protein [Capsulimonas sp.]
MTKFQHCYEGAATKSPGLTWKSLLGQLLFKSGDTTLETTATHVALWLERGECIGLTTRQLLYLECREGEAWVTIEGDARDYLLTPGQGISVPRGAHVVTQARMGSRVMITHVSHATPSLLRGRERGPSPKRHVENGA